MNFTRFLLNSRPEDRPNDRDGDSRSLKASLLFRTENRPAALFECLRPFAQRGINLTKIESRPVRGSRFEYRFYHDALVPPGRAADLDGAVRALARCSTDLRLLGSSPAGAGATPL